MKSSLCALLYSIYGVALTIYYSNGATFLTKVTKLEEGHDFRVLELDVGDPPGVFFGGNGTIIYHSYHDDVMSKVPIGVCYDASSFICIYGRPLPEGCYNYIRQVSSLGQQCDRNYCPELYFCGTNALNPSCFFCSLDNNGLRDCTFESNEVNIDNQRCKTTNIDGSDTFPWTRDENATLLYHSDKRQFFFGVRESRLGGKSLIGTREVNLGNPPDYAHVKSNSDKAVRDADFVGTPFSHGDYVYFLYRETAEEYASLSTGQDNAVEIVFSRIARVCEGDIGYIAGSDTVWSSFLKQRLVCMKPGDNEFDMNIYNEIQDFVFDAESQSIFAIFTTSRNAPSMSALCTFSLTKIDEVFDTGTFYGSDGQIPNDLWRDYSGAPVHPRPGLDCSNPYVAQPLFLRDYLMLKPDASEEAELTIDKDRLSKLELYRERPYTLLIGSENGCMYKYQAESQEFLKDCPLEFRQRAITGLSVAPDVDGDTYDVYMTTVDGIYAAQIQDSAIHCSPNENLRTHANTVVDLICQGNRDDVSFDLMNETVQILKNEILDDADPVIMRYELLAVTNDTVPITVRFTNYSFDTTLDNEVITVTEYDEREKEYNQFLTVNETLTESCREGGSYSFDVSVISSLPVFQYCSDCMYYHDTMIRDCSDLC
ncbi:semaphorin-3D-like [Diadema antillarum]|uniref:semaphorin-3D-like n=1 Tax=Diadema antillarum TaxID=105358 RepID=UPI003A8555A1